MKTSPLEILEVDLFPKEAAASHHTDRFEMVHAETPIPVLRRGDPFKATLRFKERGYDPKNDLVRLLFSFGPAPNPIKGTRGVASVTNGRTFPTDKVMAWAVALNEQDDTSVTVQVQSPVDSPVGEWRLQVETKLKSGGKDFRLFDYPDPIYLLFNPWNKNDQVWMSPDRLLDEYVLCDVGKIWVGPWGSARGRHWVFGQFDACVLRAAELMLGRAGLAPTNRGDPVAVVRALSRIVNSNDEDSSASGVLQGSWSGEYDDGTAPAAWTGSVPILDEYLSTGKEVLYGQCWVFAGVVTTVCRALGIPSRVVSNLVSAHDANATLTVDRYFDMENEELGWDPNNDFGEDSIWNYHVWNDVWMARPDLPRGYGGWQAIDSTPQETSDGLYQCGPAPLEAVKCGAVGFSFDVGFLLASVNADLVRWKVDPECELGYSKLDCNKYHIGRMILTKQPWIFDPNGDRDREDITEQYKSKEGSKAERLTLLNGVRGSDRAKRFYELPSLTSTDIEFELVQLDTVMIGDNFKVVVNIHNKSDRVRKVQAILSTGSVYYTGIKANLIKKASGDFSVQPNSKEMLQLSVTCDEYLDKLVEYCNMKIYAIATVEDTRYTWADEDDFKLDKPPLDIKVDSELIVGKAAKVVFSFKNPLQRTLTKCQLMFEGPGLSRKQSVKCSDVRGKQDVIVEQVITPYSEGSHKLVGTFVSKELLDITGTAAVEVLEQDEE